LQLFSHLPASARLLFICESLFFTACPSPTHLYQNHQINFFQLLEEKHLLRFSVDLGNVCQKVKNTTRVTPLVVVPGDKLNEVVVERDTGFGIEDGGVGVTVQVSGDDLIFGVCENTYVIMVS
jgi:hypothetical protein